ncbi:dethiobiotin synthase [Psychromonas sp. B3M02]|uniref:dethiobiotin synthase n=1 Tax=Psychromonas sp. B3M02 TaxID=2267226 RepID=UPI000DE87DE5|nr:dethiobiotin synthase [Psychromonas sp. B3M02]RBW47043.1 dethiobiotin synthase [Psychromonas sp. B3M02]
MVRDKKVTIHAVNTTYFVTGTDTDVGKTVCTRALLQAANQQNKSTIGYKPISAGCEMTDFGLRNEDALILQKNSSTSLPYEMINPIAFAQPIAPHIAASENGVKIDVKQIEDGLTHLQAMQSDLIFVEGAGGWHLPINGQQLLSDWVVEKQFPVILVVGLKLGCLNHALLTAKAIQQSGLTLVGWIANHVQHDLPYAEENINSLTALINAPLLGVIPFLDNVDEQDLSNYINIEFNRLLGV